MMRLDPTRAPLPRLDRCTDACREVLVLRDAHTHLTRVLVQDLDRVILHEVDGHEQRPRVVRAGALSVNVRTWTAAVDGQRIKLTPTERRLLVCLAANADTVVPYQTLLGAVWEQERVGQTGYHDTRVVAVNMGRIRKALGSEGGRIVTCETVGYRLDTLSVEPVPRTGTPRKTHVAVTAEAAANANERMSRGETLTEVARSLGVARSTLMDARRGVAGLRAP